LILEHDPVATRAFHELLWENGLFEYETTASVDHVEGSDPLEWRVRFAGQTVEMVMDKDLDYDGMIRSMVAAMRYALGLETRHGFKKRRRKR
jgi:hypothetical protein